MPNPDWQKERTELRAKFTSGQIMKEPTARLEWYLLVLGNSNQMWDAPEETRHFVMVINELLKNRFAEDMATRAANATNLSNSRSRKLAIWALVVSIASALISLCSAIFKSTVNDIHVPAATNNIQPAINNTVVTNIIVINTNLFRNP